MRSFTTVTVTMPSASAGEIGMHALRVGDEVGKHTAYFAALGERLELTHVATNRDTFVHGGAASGEMVGGAKAGEVRDGRFAGNLKRGTCCVERVA